MLTVLRYIEANPLRARLVERAEDYPWSSYRAHGLTYEELSPYAAVRRRNWERKVHQPLEEQALAAIRRSSAMGLPYGDEPWVDRLAKKLGLDLTIRPRGRPRKAERAE